MDTTKLRENERRLAEREALFSRAQSLVRMGVWTINSSSQDFSESSPVAREIYGLAPDQPMTMSHVAAVFHPEDEADFRKNVQNMFSDHPQPFTHKHRVVVQGETRWLLAQGYPEFGSGGQYTRFFGISIDITVQEKQRIALAGQQALLREAQRTAKMGHWIWDTETDTVIWSEEIFAILELAPNDKEIKAGNFLDFVHPEDKEGMMAGYREAIRTGETAPTATYRIITAKGKERHIFSRSAKKEEGKIYGILQDVTDLREIEHSLAAKEAQLRGITDSLPGAVLRYRLEPDGTGKVQFMSQGGEKVLGVPASILLREESKLWELILSEDLAGVQASLQASAQSLSLWSHEWRIRTAGGDFRWLNGRGHPRREPDGGTVWDALIFDVSSQKKAEQELRDHRERLEELVKGRTQALNHINEQLTLELVQRRKTEAHLTEALEALESINQELEQFTYSVSHDLRAPIRHIEGYGRILREEENDRLSEDGKRLLERVISASGRLGQMIDGLLQYSRTRNVPPNFSEVDLAQVFSEVQERFIDAQPDRKVKWEVSALPQVVADPKMLVVVFENLLGNALKYTAKKSLPHIKVWSWQERDMVCIGIQDNGAGFDMRFADKLFAVFQRLHKQREYPGNGIGLANVERIIHLHGGSIWAEGEVDKGACFYFSLPQHPKPSP
jgi:PAS domain S-box-containing protein